MGPGVPGILLGHNSHIAWSLTDTQNSATFYYAEKVKGTRYYSDGAWHPMTVVHYDILRPPAPATRPPAADPGQRQVTEDPRT